MLNYSRQRESIKKYLDSHFTHPTAETVYLDIKEEFPNISLGTVYRNLNLLADMGEVLRISLGNGPDRYDGRTNPHYHFICSTCGEVMDMDMEPIPEIDAQARQNFSGVITGHVTHFFGLCPKCNKKNNILIRKGE
ncbi:MAG: transcriptional repressor [Lachnospiraceae bacterium]|nr:transcriptional repressor [Lachnospiraceae bacterium]MDE6982395.1 transcriptional repressor [Lachnospiraceae bacterium]